MIVVYEKPTCSTCRKTVALLNERGVEFERVNYYVEPFDAERLTHLLHKGGLEPTDVLRAKTVKDLGLDPDAMSDDELITAMVENPDLIQRPIVEHGEQVVLARPPEKALELLDD